MPGSGTDVMDDRSSLFPLLAAQAIVPENSHLGGKGSPFGKTKDKFSFHNQMFIRGSLAQSAVTRGAGGRIYTSDEP
jgi:hypothetical protein